MDTDEHKEASINTAHINPAEDQLTDTTDLTASTSALIDGMVIDIAPKITTSRQKTTKSRE
ncbi:hypothetical protein [Halochromatium roseum]|uniref:hypothetical protein n=1 Tax=Halochromatium roseum TaxID=391920 RepID=UPI001912001D|nr:hypothetical protein [Halochromatium roseum]